MTLPLMPNPRQQFFGSDGKPLAGGKVYTYAAGTSTPKATYTDAAGTTPNTNPIILNARGEATVFWSGSYKVTVATSADVTIYTQDNVSGPDVGLRSDLAASTGAAAIGIAGGGTVQDLASIYANAVFSASYASVEAAHAAAVSAGKTYVVVNSAWALTGNFTATRQMVFALGFTVSCGAYTLNLSNGFIATDYQQIFTASEATKITLPFWQRLTPFHFGAKANYNGVADQGTDDGTALNAWASRLCWRVMPRGKYGTTKTVYWNGDNVQNGEVTPQFYGIRAEVDAEIIQRTDNIPVMTFYGSRGEWRFPKLSFMNDQATTNYSAIAALCAPTPGQAGGFHTSVIPYFHSVGGSCGLFFPRAISSTINAIAAAGATTVTVANAQTDFTGNYPWRVGMYVQIEMDSAYSGTTIWQSRITDIPTTTTLTIADALPVNTSVGKKIFVAPNKIASGSDTANTPTRFSNTWSYCYIERPTRFGFVDTGNGTHDVFDNLYVKDPRVSYYSQTITLQSAIYSYFRNGDRYGITNIEQFIFAGNAFDTYADSLTLGSIHFEGCKLTSTSSSGLLSGVVQSLSADLIQVQYCTMVTDDLGSATAGIFRPNIGSTTVAGGNRGIWNIGILDTGKNIITIGNGYVVRDASANRTIIQIGAWRRTRDSGFNPVDALSYANNIANILNIGGVLPSGLVAVKLDATCADLSSQGMQQISDRYKINKIAYADPSLSMTTATAGVWNETGATNLVSASGTTALSPLTGPNTIIEPGLSALEANKLRDGAAGGGVAGERPFFKCAVAQAAPAAVAAASRYLTGRQGGNNNTNLAFINFAAPHGFTVNQPVAIVDSSITQLNGNFKIVDVPSTTQLVVYCDSASAQGTSGSPITTGSITVQLRPTVDVFAFGDRYGF